jgi:Rrf2 family protein
MHPDPLDWGTSNLDDSIWPMRITEQTRYTLRIIAICAQRYPERVKVGELSRITGITSYNIFKLLKIATRAGFLESSRGPKGGVVMARSPETLSVGQVVRALEPRFQACVPAGLILPHPPTQDDVERRINEAIGRGINVFLTELDMIPITSLV